MPREARSLKSELLVRGERWWPISHVPLEGSAVDVRFDDLFMVPRSWIALHGTVSLRDRAFSDNDPDMLPVPPLKRLI